MIGCLVLFCIIFDSSNSAMIYNIYLMPSVSFGLHVSFALAEAFNFSLHMQTIHNS